MNLNVTLIIQALNFFVAYVVFRSLLLKPAVAIIQQERAQNDELRKAIDHNYTLIDQKGHERSLRWQQCHQMYLESKPAVEDPELYVFKKLSPEIEYPEKGDP
jgi:hypothetical protein